MASEVDCLRFKKKYLKDRGNVWALSCVVPLPYCPLREKLQPPPGPQALFITCS